MEWPIKNRETQKKIVVRAEDQAKSQRRWPNAKTIEIAPIEKRPGSLGAKLRWKIKTVIFSDNSKKDNMI